MKIRPAQQADVDVVPELMLQAMEDIVFQFIGKDDIGESIEFLSHFFIKTDNQYSYQNTFVMEDEDQQILGSLTAYNGDDLQKLRAPILEYLGSHYDFSTTPENETNGGEFYLDTVSIVPHQQGKGIGSALLKHGIEFAKKQSFKQVGLLVDLENPDAKRLYERLGFQLGEKTTFVGGQYYHMYLTF